MTPRRHGPGIGRVAGGSAIAGDGLPSRRRLASWLRAACVLLAAIAAAGAPVTASGDEDDKERKARLSLRASPPVAFSPARIVVTAELTGGADAELYCPEIEWEWGDDTRSEAKQNCEPYLEGESTLTRRWTQSHTYTRAGRYQAYLRLKRGDKVLVAGSVKVDVRPGAGDLSDFGR